MALSLNVLQRRWIPVLPLLVLALVGLPATARAQFGSAVVPDDVLRIIVPGSQEAIRQLAEEYGLTVTRQLSSGGALEVTAAQLAALRNDPSIGHIAADSVVEASMAVSATATGADQLWEGVAGVGASTGQGIGIAIIDSGIGDHTDLRGKVILSVDFVEPDENGVDEYGHGTHVAGIAAGGGAAGIAPGAHLWVANYYSAP